MKIITMLALALALSMDALAIAIASGYAIKRLHLHYAMRIAFSFGAFQFLMPILGWLCGVQNPGLDRSLRPLGGFRRAVLHRRQDDL